MYIILAYDLGHSGSTEKTVKYFYFLTLAHAVSHNSFSKVLNNVIIFYFQTLAADKEGLVKLKNSVKDIHKTGNSEYCSIHCIKCTVLCIA